ncbi:MAG: SHOCT domain-containing protein [Chloroflexota bacterium]
MMDGFGNMGAFWGFGMLIFWVALTALIAWGVYAVFAGRGNTVEASEGALEILKRRYASGEITQAEFEQARKAIG